MKLFALSLLFPAAVYAEPEWRPPPPGHHNGLEARGESFSARIFETPTQTRLRAVFPPPDPEETALPELKIDWEGINPTAVFNQAVAVGAVRSTLRWNGTTITRTVLLNRRDQAVFVHLLANKPGALSFRVAIGETAKVENRRELALAEPRPGRVIVWPFESDVTPEPHAISVRGEGEALVVWNFGPATLWDDLAKRYDPGSSPPNPAKIWHGLFEERTANPAAATPPP